MRIFTVMLLGLLVGGTANVHESYSSDFSSESKLELIPRDAPGTKDAIRSKSPSNQLAPGEYLSLDCELPSDILKRIKYQHRLDPIWWGEGHHGVTFMLHSNEKNGNWTLFMGVGKGKLCVVSSGMGQELLSGKRGLYH